MNDLTRIPAAQIVQYGPETIIDWLIARSEDRSARLRKALAELRAEAEVTGAAHDRLAAAVSAAARP